MAAKPKKGQFRDMAAPGTPERVPMASLKVKKHKKTSRGK
jgi:hypothetical protein